MQTTSALYNTILADPNHSFEVKLNIAGVDFGEDVLMAVSIKSKVFENTPIIGGTYASVLTFSMYSDGASIPRMAKVIPYYRAKNEAQESEWIKKGEFYIDTREVSNNDNGFDVFSAYCYDRMLLANSEYSTSALTWPATDTAVVAEICTQLGLTQDERNAAVMTGGYSIPLPTAYTKRDVLGFIAVMYGANWIMTDEGKLRIVKLTAEGAAVNIGKSLVNLNVGPLQPAYTQVVLTASTDTAYTSGSTDTEVLEAYCPYATQAVADAVKTALGSWQYQPFDASGVWTDPALELGDKLTAVDKTGVIFSRDLNFGPSMVMDLSAPYQNDINHEYAYESPTERHYKQTIGDIKREIVVTAESIVSTLSRRLDNMQEQIDNNIETFTGPAVPTLTNYPANAWTTTEEKDKHIGDLYVVNSQGGDYEGFYYRFEKTGSTYQWRLLKDTEVTKALADAEEALRRVGIAETQIEQNSEAITLRATKTEAQGYANTAQANAISAAATDATTKANAAESAAKSYADAQITISADAITSNVSATYETKAAATQKLNTAKSYAETQAADAEAAAISTAAADATTKANAAEAGAKWYTDTKLTGYSTTTQMNSAISQSAGSILQTVSETYTTKTEFGGLEDDVEAVETRVSSAESTLEVQAGQIASKVSETDYNGNTIASKINQNATTVKINAAKIDLQGAVTISDFDSAAQAALVKNTTTKTQYAQSASSTTAPTSGWQDTIPAYNATNKYIWLRVATTKTFADNTSSTTYSTPVVDVNLTKSIQDAATAQSTATGAATAASTAQTKANAALVTSVSVYFRASTSTVPGKPTAEVTSTAVDTSDAWTLCMPRPKKGTTYYTCEQNKDGNGTVSWTAVRQMANTTYVASWASSANATYIDGASIYTGTVTADKIAANEVFTQKLTATDFTITGGSINIKTSSATDDKIDLEYSIEDPHDPENPYYYYRIRLCPEYIQFNYSQTAYLPEEKSYSRITGKSISISDMTGGGVKGQTLIDYGKIRINGASVNGETPQIVLASVGTPVSGIYDPSLRFRDSTNNTDDRMTLQNSGLVFGDGSGSKTAEYANEVIGGEYMPSDTHTTPITFGTNSKIYVRKWGTTGYLRLHLNITNGDTWASGQDHYIYTLPSGFVPKTAHNVMVPNELGTSSCLVQILTTGEIVLFRYAGSAAWAATSRIRCEIPMDF